MMRLAVAIADKNADANAFVVWRGFEESIEKARAYGYDGVELAVKTREEVDVAALSRLLERRDMQVSAVSTGQLFSALGLYLTDEDTVHRKRAIGALCDLAEMAGQLCSLINLGRVRGFCAPNQTRARVEHLFLESLETIAERAERHGVTVVIEPVNRYEINFINTLDECADLLAKVRAPNVGMMPDVFHMNIEDDRIGDSLHRNAKHIRYIHLADSNRHAPGDGHLDFDEVFSSIEKMSYTGWLAVEILPVPTPDEAAARAIAFLQKWRAR